MCDTHFIVSLHSVHHSQLVSEISKAEELCLWCQKTVSASVLQTAVLCKISSVQASLCISENLMALLVPRYKV